jgi:hypothetical protein
MTGGERRAGMTMVKMAFPELAGKTVEEIVLYDDPLTGREVAMRFSDGTELSISIRAQQCAEARYFARESEEAIFERRDIEAPPPCVEL